MINIVITLDEHYVIPALVMLDSMFEHNSKSNIHLFVIVQDNTLKLYNNIKNLAVERGAQCTILEIQTSKLKNAKISHHISLATYYRLLLSDTIPYNIEKILFLDCDILIKGPINDLYETNIQNYDIAAVEDPFDNNHKSLIGMDLDRTYFNAGVMLVNLKNWRLKCYTKKFIDYLKVNHHKIVFWDQDVLNASIENRLILDKKWNLTESNHNDFLSNKIEANVLHFTGKCKPWNCHLNILTEVYFSNIIQSGSTTLNMLFFRVILLNLVRQIKNLEIKSMVKQILLIFGFKLKKINLFMRYYDYRQL